MQQMSTSGNAGKLFIVVTYYHHLCLSCGWLFDENTMIMPLQLRHFIGFLKVTSDIYTLRHDFILNIMILFF